MIRFAKDTDLSNIYDLLCELENTRLNYEMFCSIYFAKLQDDNYCNLIYEVDNQIIGFLNLRMEAQLHHAGRVAEIMELAVKSGFRSQGVGHQLMKRACDIAREQQCLLIEVCCNQRRSLAHHFYEKVGLSKSHFKFTMNLD